MEHRVQKWREFWVRQDLESDSSFDRKARTGDRITDTIAAEEKTEGPFGGTLTNSRHR